MAKDSGVVNIHGKEYQTVASRVSQFRDKYKEEYAIVTQLISRDETTVVMKAKILKGDQVLATGYAEENRNSSSINRTSALENCETSAIGRALAAFGMAGTEYASADEVAQAIGQQNQTNKPSRDALHYPLKGMATEKQRELVAKMMTDRGIAQEDQRGYLIEQFGVGIPLTREGASFVIDELTAESKKVVMHA
jgi:deoxycytidylate deaminase